MASLGNRLGRRFVYGNRQVMQLLRLFLLFIAAEEGLVFHCHDVNLSIIPCTPSIMPTSQDCKASQHMNTEAWLSKLLDKLRLTQCKGGRPSSKV